MNHPTPPSPSQEREQTDLDRLMMPKEVASLFRVDSKTVREWTRQGRLPSIRTPGGHHRYLKSEVDKRIQTPES